MHQQKQPLSPTVHIVSDFLHTSQTPEALHALIHYPLPALYLSLAHMEILAIAMVVQAKGYYFIDQPSVMSHPSSVSNWLTPQYNFKTKSNPWWHMDYRSRELP